MSRWATAARAGVVVAIVAVPLACGPLRGVGGDAGATVRDAGPAAARTSATWTDGAALITSRDLVRGRIDVPGGTGGVTLRLDNAYPVTLPEECQQSTVKILRSYLDGDTLGCRLVGGTRSLTFTAIVVGDDGTQLGGTVTTRQHGDSETTQLPGRLIIGGDPTLEPGLRLVSSPDFTNADIGDLRQGPGYWTPQRSTNATDADYEAALDHVLDDWDALDPAAVLVAGDLVNGRWGYDDRSTGTFGPVDTLAEKRQAIRLAARTFYPQWLERFTSRDLEVYPTIGDHEYGDNAWPRGKRLLAATYRDEFARAFSFHGDGTSRYASHPRGPHATTAFAGRPSPDVQIVSLDVFDITPAHARIQVDPQQLRWLRGVLAQAKADGVRWTIVESHVPIAGPVRSRASSALTYRGGTHSRLWKLMDRFDVDLYLSGEVHDSQLLERDGIVQISHGGAFQFGLTTALVMDFYGDNLFLSLRDYDLRHHDAGPRLWETRRSGMPTRVDIARGPLTIGTASLGPQGLVSSSGILAPVHN